MDSGKLKIVYIYTLSCPLTGQVRYVGKTVNLKRRLSEHLTKKNYRCKKSKWVESLKQQGLKPIITILDQCSTQEVKEIEGYWIFQLKAWGFDLVNTQDGGDQAPYKFSSKYQSRKRV